MAKIQSEYLSNLQFAGDAVLVAYDGTAIQKSLQVRRVMDKKTKDIYKNPSKRKL